MKHALHQRVLHTIEKHSMLRLGDSLGVGVSGGADSVGLLRLLTELQPRLGIRILVLHFHHQLRGAEADADERFVREFAAGLGLPFASGRADVAAEAQRNGWNVEDAGRRLRYRFFESIAASRGLNRVATAHTQDDQAETVLAHLLRGTGPAGLAGIYPVSGVIIRPLLEIGRDEIRNYLLKMNQAWREDSTNQDTSRTRARIRHRLLPVLQQEFAPSAAASLARLASLAREDETFWRALEEERFTVLVSREPAGELSLDIADLLAPLSFIVSDIVSKDRAPDGRSDDGSDDASGPRRAAAPSDMSTVALTRRLVRRVFLELRGSRQQLTARHVEDVLHLAAKSQSGSRIELPGVVVERVFNRLVFSVVPAVLGPKGARRKHRSTPQFEYVIAIPSAAEPACITVPELGRRFNLKVIDWPAVSRETESWGSIIDCDRLRRPLVFRNWRPGDSYRPYRHRRVRKLKRLLLESRVSIRDRAGWPVLTSAGALVWAPQCPVADEFAPSPETRKGLAIVEEAF
jgi:tRNA(Ile)-lysidine synthase